MSVLVVTGTDTEVGKTVATAALACALRAQGATVAVVKPAQTGVDPDAPGDAGEVRRLAGVTDIGEGIRLPDPLAPDRAAALAGVALPSLADQGARVLAAAARRDVVLVEGSGGVLVRLGEAFTLLDLAGYVEACGAAVAWVVVARAGLGTLNHASLTVDAIRSRGMTVRGVVIGAWPVTPGLAERHNRDDLPRYTGVPLLGAIPAGAGSLPPAVFQAEAPLWIPAIGPS